jgi:PST family polysaccharide transporter
VPFWVLYRRLEFKRQRLYQAIDPVVAFVVTIVLAILGAGYWSLILGVLAGSWTGALVALSISPYKLRLRTDRLTRASYISFSLPLFVASVGGIVIAQGSIFFGEAALGLVGAGAITLSAQITQLAQRVDEVVTSTLYPVICAVADKRDVLFETFTKSNRIALMWAMPFGIGLALFGADLVHDVLGHKWEPAIGILQATGVAAGLSQLGFNWTSYVRALGDTRPIAVNTVTQAVVFLATVPLFYVWGRAGYAASVLIVLGASLVVRSIYLRRIFQGFGVMSHAVRALLPSVPAVAAVLLVRLATGGGTRSTAEAVAELLLYAAVTVAATLAFERALLAEALGYLRRRYGGAPAPA